nr:hypothetical protein Iba_chr02fCG4620 [Ipomoea batatas]
MFKKKGRERKWRRYPSVRFGVLRSGGEKISSARRGRRDLSEIRSEMDGEENESFGEVEQQLRPGSAAKDMRKSRNVQPGMSSTLQRRPRHLYSPYRHSGLKVPEDTGKDRTPSQPSLTGQHEKWRR